MAKGLDCGTGNFCVVDSKGIRLQRNAFLTIDQRLTTKKQLKVLGVPFVEVDNRLHIVGRKAFEYAQVFGTTELKRPMAHGVLNPLEQDAFPILRLIIGGLLEEPETPGELVVYCIPGTPIDQEQGTEYHSDVLKSIIESFGYTAHPINEAVALGNEGLKEAMLTGISVSMGAGMCNVAISFLGMSALQFSIAKGGDWIDENVSRDCGIPRAQAQYIKELGNYTIDPKSTVERTREQQAIKSYYEALIRYILANIARQFESREMPNFSNDVPIIIAGGTSMVNGFIEVFKDQFQQKQFPLKISEIKLADEPLTAVARGCYADAVLETE
jgi:actin-like ATPase involved in cell morphogenesis